MSDPVSRVLRARTFDQLRRGDTATLTRRLTRADLRAFALASGDMDPTHVDAAVPPLAHHSALLRYRPQSDDARLDWRAANAEVARIGGWRAYLREAQAPEPAASAPVAPTGTAPTGTAPTGTAPTGPAPMPHHDHRHHAPGGRR